MQGRMHGTRAHCIQLLEAAGGYLDGGYMCLIVMVGKKQHSLGFNSPRVIVCRGVHIPTLRIRAWN